VARLQGAPRQGHPSFLCGAMMLFESFRPTCLVLSIIAFFVVWGVEVLIWLAH
jgi:hypothetical protein